MIQSLYLIFAIISHGSCVKISERAPEVLAWWQEELIYQIYPRSHKDSDGDGVGDLLGIQSKLDHFVDIGVGAVWISPIYKSPMADFGYDISNFTDIEPIFGNMTSFKSLSDALKKRDIKLIMDFVPNHSSDQHPWFQLSVKRVEPYTDYYVWKDPKGYDEFGNPIVPNNWISVFGGSMWQWREERKQFYLHQFLVRQPDLNYENPKVLVEMLDALKFWLDLGVDGLRVDAVAHIFEDMELQDEPEDPNRPPGSLPSEWFYYSHLHTYNLPKVLEILSEFRQLLDFYSVGDGKERCMTVEVPLLPLEDLFKYYGTETRPIANFPLNFEFFNRIHQNFTAQEIVSLIDEWFELMPEGRTANWVLGNHDNHRVSARFGDYAIDPFNMIIHLLPGSSITYYGEEIGMQDMLISWADTIDPAGCNAGPDRYELFSRDPERTPMQWDGTKNAGFSTANTTWLPVNENYTFINVAAQFQGAEETHLKIYKRISHLRKSDAWKFGSLETKALNNGNVIAYSRIYNGNGFVVIANFGNEEVHIDMGKEFDQIPLSVTVFAKSMGFLPEGVLIGDPISADAVTVGSRHSLIIQF